MYSCCVQLYADHFAVISSSDTLLQITATQRYSALNRAGCRRLSSASPGMLVTETTRWQTLISILSHQSLLSCSFSWASSNTTSPAHVSNNGQGFFLFIIRQIGRFSFAWVKLFETCLATIDPIRNINCTNELHNLDIHSHDSKMSCR